MTHQMSFDFPLEAAFVPAPSVPFRRRRVVAGRSSPPALSPQLALAAPGDSDAAPAHIEIRLPVVVPQRPASGVAADAALRASREWCESGWTARVVRTEDADAWVVEMRFDGESEPALVAPWSAERDALQPRPLDQSAFNALLRKASGTLQRQIQQRNASLHKRQLVASGDSQWEVTLTIVPDDFEPHAVLEAFDENGEHLAREKVRPDFRLTESAARAWIEADFRCIEAL